MTIGVSKNTHQKKKILRTNKYGKVRDVPVLKASNVLSRTCSYVLYLTYVYDSFSNSDFVDNYLDIFLLTLTYYIYSLNR